MAYVDGFKNDVFISYAHIDNVPSGENREGWITEFHLALEIQLSELIGKKPYIWRDLKLQGNDFFGDTIIERLHQTAVFVSVISPSSVSEKSPVRVLH